MPKTQKTPEQTRMDCVCELLSKVIGPVFANVLSAPRRAADGKAILGGSKHARYGEKGNNTFYQALQVLLEKFTGHKNIYISPWKRAAVSAGFFYFNPEGKVMLIHRAQPEINAGGGLKWSYAGGFIDMENHEHPFDAAVRHSDTKLDWVSYSLRDLNPNSPDSTLCKHPYDMAHELNNYGLILIWNYHMNKAEVKMSGFNAAKKGVTTCWVNLAELRDLQAQGALSLDGEYQELCKIMSEIEASKKEVEDKQAEKVS